MLKIYAPKGLHGGMLRAILADLQATPADIAKHLRVTERSVWRWLADDSAPYAVLAALWHETPRGRETGALDVGNELVIVRGLARSTQEAHAKESARLARLVAIADTGAGNDPLFTGPFSNRDAVQLGKPPRVRPLGGFDSGQARINLNEQTHPRNEQQV